MGAGESPAQSIALHLLQSAHVRASNPPKCFVRRIVNLRLLEPLADSEASVVREREEEEEEEEEEASFKGLF